MKNEVKASPALHFIKPDLNFTYQKLASVFFPILQYFGTNIRNMNVLGIEKLAEKYLEIQNKESRVLVAFRHPNADDPMSLVNLFWRKLPQELNRMKQKQKAPVHFHFVWDRGIPIWAGDYVANLYSKLGGIPIHRGKVDWKGLNTIRETFLHSKYPVLIAPEGATNGHNELMSPLEPGLAQLGIWCLEDLKKENRNEKVIILPLGIKYKYQKENWTGLEKVLNSYIHDLGADYLSDLKIPESNFKLMNESQKKIYSKLMNIFHSVIFILENYFEKYYHKTIVNIEKFDIQKRISVLSDSILSVEESFFNLKPRGSIIDRCRKLEQASWDWIYRENIDLEKSSKIERKLLDKIALESKRQDWNMRLVESFVAIDNDYIPSKPSFERFADITYLLNDTITKIIFGSGQKRPVFGNLDGELKIGEEILVNKFSTEIETGRLGAKSAMQKITEELTQKMNSLL